MAADNPLVIIAVIIFALAICRLVVNWYLKINDRVELMQKQIDQNDEILKELRLLRGTPKEQEI